MEDYLFLHSECMGWWVENTGEKNESKLLCGPSCRRAYVVERDEVYQSGVITNDFFKHQCKLSHLLCQSFSNQNLLEMLEYTK